jgi:GTP-binding protein
MRAPIVSLIGRPNVGKSTIYNRLLKRGNKILTHDLPGVTRDRHYSILSTGDVGEFDSQDLILIDTGGFYPEEVEENQRLKKKENYEPFFNIMREQAQLAISESDLILFVVDVREGMLPFDQQIIDYLRRSKKTFWVLVNKFDSENQYGDEVEFYSLGIDEFLLTSAEHNRGMDEIRERLCKFSHEMKQKLIDEPSLDNGMSPEHEVVADVAIIGAPNVGKSTLLNRLIGEKRALVSDIAGTTVDPIEGYFNLNFGQRASELKAQKNEFYKHNKDILEAYREHQEQLFTAQEQVEQLFDEAEDDELDEQEVFTDGWRSIKIVDTAGIRKNKLVSGHIESQSVYRSLRSITESEIVIFLVDATKGITHQDRRLMDIALDKGKSLIICLNKIDLVNEIMQDREQKARMD